MKPSRREKWAKTKEKGFARYMLVNGLLYIGVPAAIIFGFIANAPEAFDVSGDERYMPGAFRVACGMLTGFIFGLFLAFSIWRGWEVFLKWKETRNAGLLRYILFEGILSKGLPLAGLFSVILLNYSVYSRQGIDRDILTFSSAAKIISLGILLGIMYGFSTWFSNESKTFWSDTRAGGKTLFFIKQGLFLYGWPYAISMTAFNYLLRYRRESIDLENYLLSAEAIGSFVFYALFFGVIMGFLVWSENEKEHVRETERQANAETS